jgi:hypothetical protein
VFAGGVSHAEASVAARSDQRGKAAPAPIKKRWGRRKQQARQATPLVNEGKAAAVSHAKTTQALALSAPKLGFDMRLFAWSIDFVFVVACVGVAVALAVVLSAARAGDGEGWFTRNWLVLPPMQWLAGVAPLYALGGVYGVYLLYHLVFKILAGATVGESLVTGFRQRRT